MIALALATLIAAAPEGALEGQPAPSFRLYTADRSLLFRLDERAYPGPEKKSAKKRPVFLDFFRTDCAPCRAALPELVKLHEAYSARGVEFAMIALLEPEDGQRKLAAFLADKKLPFTVLVDDTEHYAKKFLGPTAALPATFLLDRDGVIRKVKRGGQGTLEEHFGAELARATEPK